MNNLRWLGVALLATAVTPAASNGQPADAEAKSFRAVRTTTPPLVDGRLDDAVWQHAAIVDDMHEVSPNEYQPPSEPTRFYVLIDADNLYIGARLTDGKPDQIVSRVLRQGDTSNGDDSIKIIIDPFNNGRGGYWFSLNPNGIRSEALFKNITEQNTEWQGIWNGAARVDDEGWTAEIQIPFKTLSFNPENDVWGINFNRRIGRRNEDIGWVSYNRAQTPANSGKISGMTGLRQGLGLDIVPGLIASSSRDYLLPADDNSLKPSLDLFYKPTPSVTAAITFNTDFSGTSADVRQINLTRFSVFVPEQRVFFLQDTDIFEFGRIGGPGSGGSNGAVIAESGRPFFSRRIGLNADGDPIDIDAGLKLTGRIGGWEYGVLDIQQSEYVTSDLDPVSSRNLFVGRVAAPVLKESTIGLIATYGDPRSNLENSLLGVDFRYLNTRLANNRTLEGALWAQQSSTEGLDGDDTAFGASLSAPNTEGWNGSVSFRQFGEDYNPALGFVRQTNLRDYELIAGHIWRPSASWIRTIESKLIVRESRVIGGRMDEPRIELIPAKIENNFGDSASITVQHQGENFTEPFEISEGVILPAGDYLWNRYCLRLGTGEQRRFSIVGYYCDGDYLDGQRISIGPDMVWRPSEHFRLAVSYRGNHIDLPHGNFVARLTTVNADFAFTSTLYWENLIQYDNVSDNIGINSIFRWMPRAGREVVFVVNREFVDFDETHTFVSTTSQLVAKAIYTLRF